MAGPRRAPFSCDVVSSKKEFTIMIYTKPEVRELGDAAVVIQASKQSSLDGDGPFTMEVGAYGTEE